MPNTPSLAESPGVGGEQSAHTTRVRRLIPLHSSYPLVRKGLRLLARTGRIDARQIGPSLNVTVQTGERVSTTLQNLGLANRGKRGDIQLTDRGAYLASALDTPSEADGLRSALESLPEFVDLWARVKGRHGHVRTSTLKEVLMHDFRAAPKSAFNMASVTMGFLLGAGFVEPINGSKTARVTHVALSDWDAPSRPPGRSRETGRAELERRLVLLLALGLASRNESQPLPFKSEILDLLDKGGLATIFVPNLAHAGKIIQRLGRTLSDQLRRALEADDRTAVSNILEVLEVVS